jgi:hypothetical protein
MPYNSCLLLSVTEAFTVLIKSQKSKDDLHQNIAVTSDRIHSKTQPCSGEPCRTVCDVTLEVGRRYKECRDVLSSSINQCSPRIIKKTVSLFLRGRLVVCQSPGLELLSVDCLLG